MSRLPLFDGPDDVPPAAASLAPKLRALAERGVFLGTSSWKYEGWLGSLYDPALYQTRGKFSARKFQAECLGEYARVFPIAGGAFTFYQSPSAASWKDRMAAIPPSPAAGNAIDAAITYRGLSAGKMPTKLCTKSAR